MAKPEKLGGGIHLYAGDCLVALDRMKENSVDSAVTDPPYHLTSITKRFSKTNLSDKTKTSERSRNRSDSYARLVAGGFMGAKWDGGDIAFRVETWEKVFRVLKPGAHLVAFGGTRTMHRMVCAIEDAGFEIRDSLQWIYGSGFPKSHDVSKGIERLYECRFIPNAKLVELLSKHSLVELREETTDSVLGHVAIPLEAAKARLMVIGGAVDSSDLTDTYALESMETTCLNTATLWKSISEDHSNHGRRFITITKLGTITESKILNLLPKLNTLGSMLGVGTALKPAFEPIVLARKPLSEKTVAKNVMKWGTGALNIDGCRIEGYQRDPKIIDDRNNGQTWSDDKTGLRKQYFNKGANGRWPANILHDGSDEVVGAFPDVGKSPPIGSMGGGSNKHSIYGDFAGARHENGYGDQGSAARFFYSSKADSDDRLGFGHATVKPVDLMQWLVRLITPPGGYVLDPFAGTGTTGEAAWRERCKAILIEAETKHQDMIRRRVEAVLKGTYAREIAKMARKKPDVGKLFG